MSNKRFGCLGIALFLLLCVSVLFNFFFLASRGTPSGSSALGKASAAPHFDEATVVAGQESNDKKIALIYLRGVITSAEPGSLGTTMVDDIKIQLSQAAADAKIKAIVLYIDSPGGEVTASDMIYSAVRRVRDEAKKPVVVYMGSMAASGGYYVACAGSWLMANDTTFTGSIGVIMQSLNYQQLFGKLGLESVTFKSGKFKDMLSGSRPMTEDEKQYVQGLIMQTYGKFVGIVAKERNLPEDQLRNGVADGRVVSGKDAVEAGLINEIGEVEGAYAKAMEMGNAKGATIIRYEAGFKLGRILRMLGQSEKTKIQVDLAQSIAPRLELGHMYYLPTFYAQ